MHASPSSSRAPPTARTPPSLHTAGTYIPGSRCSRPELSNPYYCFYSVVLVSVSASTYVVELYERPAALREEDNSTTIPARHSLVVVVEAHAQEELLKVCMYIASSTLFVGSFFCGLENWRADATYYYDHQQHQDVVVAVADSTIQKQPWQQFPHCALAAAAAAPKEEDSAIPTVHNHIIQHPSIPRMVN